MKLAIFPELFLEGFLKPVLVERISGGEAALRPVFKLTNRLQGKEKRQIKLCLGLVT